MSLKVDQYWIVGRPDLADSLVWQVINWASQSSGWNPTTEQRSKIADLSLELQSKYDSASEGYAAFATEIIDSVLNRIYPYLAQYSKDGNVEISLDRTKSHSRDEGDFIIYDIQAKKSEEEPVDPLEGETIPIDENPFPLPTRIDETTEPIPAGTPGNPYGPMFPGVPFNPYDPFAREPSPYVPRNTEPKKTFDPSGESENDIPISSRPTYSDDDVRSLPVVGVNDRESEIPISGEEEGEGEEDEGEDEGEGEGEGEGKTEEPKEEAVSDELLDLLNKILQEIINQGSLTRDALRETQLTSQGILSEIQAGLENVISTLVSTTSDIASAITNSVKSLVSSIETVFSDTIDGITKGFTGLVAAIGEKLDSMMDTFKTLEWFPSESLSEILHISVGPLDSPYLSVLESLVSTVGFLVDPLGAVSDSIDKQSKNFTDSIETWFSVEPESVQHWICEFFGMAESLKDACPWLGKERS